MTLTSLDWTIIGSVLSLFLVVGVLFQRRASRGLESFFVSGRSLPWWLAGTSMVATTFAADTPLAVTGMVAAHGVAGNWLWWNLMASTVLTVFLYAHLWRRAGILTDAEFSELRYGGRPAAFLRAFRAAYLALAINLIIMGWVILAMAKVLGVVLGTGRWVSIAICLGVVLVYVTLSGLWGVVVTDFLQFALAMAGSIILAVVAVGELGGLGELVDRITDLGGGEPTMLRMLPLGKAAWMPLTTILVYLGVQWWASWYPGAEPGGGGYIAQRIFSARDERHSVLATLWFAVAHYALRPWPWILVALASVLLYPNLVDAEIGYVRVMVDLLPAGLLGMMVAAFAAAFMSTISTQLNWGSSYLVNDLYRRFLVRRRQESHYVLVSRLATILLAGLGALAAAAMTSIEGAWKFLLAMGAGTGPVYLLRWYWWRINAWSEVSAMVAALLGSLVLQWGFGLDVNDPGHFAVIMLLTVVFSTMVWVAVTFMTRPEEEEVLHRFYRRIRPAGSGWSRVARNLNVSSSDAPLALSLSLWILGCVVVYAALFGIGQMLLGSSTTGLLMLTVAAVVGGLLWRRLSVNPPSPPWPESSDSPAGHPEQPNRRCSE